ncbi:hypothetical protein KDX23_07250 [Burkholderia vietnamiensis]|uniref:ankyrin repeat domain-containing protein n=1 Tax=Burkholderia vietnamiensis TaxID=60552 RepID=UPI001BA0C696|nr:hypothetical protein [Burkholderia vietnamiensis]MBR8082539.1 hypothetical protein [Burkholderia vietnamiensis]
MTTTPTPLVNPWKLPRSLANLLPVGVHRGTKDELTFGQAVEQAWLDRTGETPLHVYMRHRPARQLSRSSWRPVFKEVVALGLDVNAKDGQGRTVMQEAMADQDFGWSHLIDLVKLGADPAQTDLSGNTILHLAAEDYPDRYALPIENLLTVPGVDVNAQNKEGSTVLHMLCGIYVGYDVWLEDVQRLLAAGADVELRDSLGRTTLDRLLENINRVLERGEPLNPDYETARVLLEQAVLRAQSVPTAVVAPTSARRRL